MVALGLLLVVVALVVGALACWSLARSTSGVLLEGAGLSVTVLPLSLLLLGAAVVVVLWLGWRLVVAGSRRRRAEREELRRLRTHTRDSGGHTAAERRTTVTGRESASTVSREAGAAPSAADRTAPDRGMPDRTVQPRTGTEAASERASGAHADDQPPRGQRA